MTMPSPVMLLPWIEIETFLQNESISPKTNWWLDFNYELFGTVRNCATEHQRFFCGTSDGRNSRCRHLIQMCLEDGHKPKLETNLHTCLKAILYMNLGSCFPVDSPVFVRDFYILTRPFFDYPTVLFSDICHELLCRHHCAYCGTKKVKVKAFHTCYRALGRSWSRCIGSLPTGDCKSSTRQ